MTKFGLCLTILYSSILSYFLKCLVLPRITLLKDAAELICDPLKVIFNESLKESVFPDIWKTARVTPIFKSGRQSDLNNYRPISILSAVSRIFEKVAGDQLFEFLTANNLLSKNQFAYRKLHSTITSLLNVTDSWYSNVD